jgi:hypothetical protein
MAKLKKRDIKKALKELTFEAAKLSNNKGRFIRNDHCPNKYNSKKRRHDGRITPRLAGKGKYSEIFEEANEPQIVFDEWQTRKDGIHFDPDNTHIRSLYMSGGGKCRNCDKNCQLYNTCFDKDRPIYEINKKLKKYKKIREAKKEKLINKTIHEIV